MGKESNMGRRALYGIIISLLFTSTGYAQGRQAASGIGELTKEIEAVNIRHNDLDRDLQQTKTQLQVQIGDQSCNRNGS